MRAPLDPRLMPVPSTGALPGPQRLSLLLVEDDRADALLVEELITDAAIDIDFVWSQSIADAASKLSAARPDCVLLDLNLPDAQGIDALRRVGELDSTIPIIVLTGLNDEHFGVSAVASGAQDYLVKGRVDPEMLRRAVLYAIERKRAELTAVDLHASRLRAQENARLERGLLPSPLLHDNPGVNIVTQSLPSRREALLGGDFYDVVQTPDRTVHVMIGDVAGHGPDEAALCVALRIRWRALNFAGTPGHHRQRQPVEERHSERSAGTGSHGKPPTGQDAIQRVVGVVAPTAERGRDHRARPRRDGGCRQPRPPRHGSPPDRGCQRRWVRRWVRGPRTTRPGMPTV